MKRLFFLLTLSFLVLSCGGSDDICESGEGTPRMKVSFKNGDKLTTLDSLKVYVDLGNSTVDLGWKTNAESILVPLRVDNAPYTEMYIKTGNKQDSSKVRVTYNTKTQYVSPGCGVKMNYTDLNGELLIPNSVIKIENGQNFIENEEKTNLYLIF